MVRPHQTRGARTAPRPSPGPSRRLDALAVVSMTIVVLLCTVPFHAGTGDMFLQILSGQYFWAHGFPRLDPFSYTAADHRWIEHEWLACLVFALVWHVGGVPGVVVWKTVVVGLTYWCTYQTARRLGARLSLLVLTWPCVVYIVTWRVFERPHLYTTLGLAVYGYLLTGVRQDQLRLRWLWLIPGLHLLWVNLHGGWVTGLALLACWVLGEAGHWLRAQPSGAKEILALPSRTMVQLVALLPVCAALSWGNPYGTDLLRHPWRMAQLAVTHERNFEWMGLHRWLYATPVFWVFLTYLATLWSLWFSRYRQRRNARDGLLLGAGVVCLGGSVLLALGPPPTLASLEAYADVTGRQTALQLVLYGLPVLWALFGILHWRTINLVTMGVVTLFTLLSLKMTRAIPDMVLVTYPAWAAMLSPLVVKGPQGAGREQGLLRRGIGLLACLAACVGLYGLPYEFTPWPRSWGWGIDGQTQPVCATAFMVRHGLQGRVYTTAPVAPFLLFQRWPRVHVNIDTRDFVYGDALFRLHLAELRTPALLEAHLARYDPHVLLLHHTDLSREVYALLFRLGWQYVYMDNRFFIMAPRRGMPAPWLTAHAIEHLHPWKHRPVTPANALQVLAEAERVLAACPPHATFAWAFKARALDRLGRYADAAAAARNIPQYIPITQE